MASESVTDLLRRAQAIVDTADLRPEFHSVAFGIAADELRRQTAPVHLASGAEPQPAAPTGLRRIAERLELDRGPIDQVFADSGGDLELIVPPSRLASSRRAAMRELIHLTVLGRQAGGYDEALTPVAFARATCEDYPKFYDRNNFANALSDLADLIRKSGDAGDQLRLTPIGLAKGRSLVVRLGGVDPRVNA